MDKLKKSFTFIGFVLAGLAAVAYLILLYIIIGGFEKGIETDKLLMFLINVLTYSFLVLIINTDEKFIFISIMLHSFILIFFTHLHYFT